MKKLLKITALLLVLTFSMAFSFACFSTNLGKTNNNSVAGTTSEGENKNTNNNSTPATETYTVTITNTTNDTSLKVEWSATANGTFKAVTSGTAYAKNSIIKVSIKNSSNDKITLTAKIGDTVLQSRDIEGIDGNSSAQWINLNNITLNGNLVITATVTG